MGLCGPESSRLWPVTPISPYSRQLYPCTHALQLWFPSRWILNEKLSTVSLGTSIKVKKRDEERPTPGITHIHQPSPSYSCTCTFTFPSHILLFSHSHPQTCPRAKESSLNINTPPDSHTSLKSRLSSKTLVNPKSLLHPLPQPFREEGGNPCQSDRTKADGRAVAVMNQRSKMKKKMMMNGEMYSEEEAKKDPR